MAKAKLFVILVIGLLLKGNKKGVFGEVVEESQLMSSTDELLNGGYIAEEKSEAGQEAKKSKEEKDSANQKSDSQNVDSNEEAKVNTEAPKLKKQEAPKTPKANAPKAPETPKVTEADKTTKAAEKAEEAAKKAAESKGADDVDTNVSKDAGVNTEGTDKSQD